MKILFTLKPLPKGIPGGGGCFFVRDLSQYFLDKGFDVVFNLQPNIDLIFMVDPRKNRTNNYSIDTIIQYKTIYPNVKVMYAVNECDIKRDVSINIEPLIIKTILNCNYVVFISKWLKNYYFNKYEIVRHIINKSYVINNACNLNIFKPTDNKKLNKNKIKLVTHHWSDNYNKGFYIYNKLANLLETNKSIEFTYIGRYHRNAIPRTVNYIHPISDERLANEIRKNDIYLTASLYEPGGIHQLEGMACGLPVLYRTNGGGIKESVLNSGEEFEDIDDLIVKLNKIVDNYDEYRDNIDYKFLSSERFCEEYYTLITKIILNNIVITTNEGGLANRIKSWVSCYRITPNNENVRVYWPILDNYVTKKHILNCSFNKLFTNNIEIENLSSFKNSNDHTISIYNSHCLKIFDSDKLPINFNTFNSQCAVRFTMNDPMRRNIDFMYNKIPNELIQEYRELFKIVKPITKLQDKIDTFGSKFNENSVSVHIRSWNRKNEMGRRAYLHNVIKFEKEMMKYGAEYNFFIATDSMDVRKYFTQKSVLKDRVMLYQRTTDLNTSRDFPEGVQEDLIELYLLSKNRILIGSHFSTFTEVAWWLGPNNMSVTVL